MVLIGTRRFKAEIPLVSLQLDMVLSIPVLLSLDFDADGDHELSNNITQGFVGFYHR